MVLTYKGIRRYGVSVDEMLMIVGSYGRFQKLINLILCLITLPSAVHIMIMYFAAHDPEWRCSANSTRCLQNRSFHHTENQRCKLDRADWEYTKPPAYSISTQFDLNCDRRWILELLESSFFAGWILGSSILGWFSDKYGRKLTLIISLKVVMFAAFLCAFMPSIQYIIACRFLIGVFFPGTITQCFIIITEIVGKEHRSFAGMMVFLASTCSLTLLGVKAYYIQNWKYLHIACTVPYILLLFLCNFLPESIRYLRTKNKVLQLETCFQRIAEWNKTKVPNKLFILPLQNKSMRKEFYSGNIFLTTKIRKRTMLLAFVYFVSGVGYCGLFITAEKMSKAPIYRDYIIITACEIPFLIVNIYFNDILGRKKTTMIPLMFVCFSCIALSFSTQLGTWKLTCVILSVIGKCLIGSVMDTISTWSAELYATQMRSGAIGVFQTFAWLGTTAAPWLNKEVVKINSSIYFLIMAFFLFVSVCLLGFLKETKNKTIHDSVYERFDVSEIRRPTLVTHLLSKSTTLRDYTNIKIRVPYEEKCFFST